MERVMYKIDEIPDYHILKSVRGYYAIYKKINMGEDIVFKDIFSIKVKSIDHKNKRIGILVKITFSSYSFYQNQKLDSGTTIESVYHFPYVYLRSDLELLKFKLKYS